MRKLQLMLGSLALVPLAASALGLGSIKIHSALNEPLKAEIELLSASPADVKNLSVRLASYDAFARAGIERPASLMMLDFKVEPKGGGKYVVKVTSRQPVREPFLDFLLDTEWQDGRMLREYTVLLDPPKFLAGKGAAVQAPQTAAVTVPTPAPVAAEAAPASVVPTPAMPQAPHAAPAAVPAPATATAPAQEAAPAPVTAPGMDAAPVGVVADEDTELFPRKPIGGAASAAGALDYGISSAQDTAWSVARKLRPDESVSVQQVLMALLKSNPDAFEGGNVNRLKAGYVLRIDDPSLLTAMSQEQAVHAVAEQNAAWDALKARLAAAPAKQTLIASDRMAAQDASAHVAKPAELKLVSTEGVGSGSDARPDATAKGGGDAAPLRERLTAAREAAEAEHQRNAELADRLKALQSRLDSMQRLLSLKDDQLAALQAQAGAAPAEDASAEASAEAQSVEAQAVEPQSVEAQAVEPQSVEPQSVEAQAVEPQSVEPQSVEPQSVEQAQPAAAAEPTAPAPATAPSAAAPVEAKTEPQPAPAQASAAAPAVEDLPPPRQAWWQTALVAASGVFAAVMASPSLLIAGAALVLVLLLLLLVVARRRRKADSKFQESILRGGAPAAAGAAGTAGADEPASEESSFLSDFAVSGMGDLDAEDNEVDPLTEADVYMAYGRYQQAEELLKQAIDNEPGRTELQFKLAELYHAMKNKGAFESLAEELYAKTDDAQAPAWKKVLGMGRELAPANPLFADAADAAAPSSAATVSDDEVMDIGLDTGIFQVDDLQPQAPAETASAEAAPADDFDLGSMFPEDEASGTEPQAGEEALDFDLAVGDDAVASASLTGASGAAGENDAGLDFDLDLGAASEAAPEAAAGDGALDFDVDFALPESGDTATADAAGTAGESADQGDGLDFDLGDLDFAGLDSSHENASAFDEAAVASDADTSDMGGEAGLISDLDEVGTKLDLARAYIDMGDADGARSILDEVLEEGDGTQQQEAQSLLKQIA